MSGVNVKRPGAAGVVAAAVALLMTGCSLAPVYQTPALPVPARLSEAAAVPPSSAAAQAQIESLGWVQAPALREVMALALTHNRDLRGAVASIEKARAQYGITRADLLPSVTASGQLSRSRTAADLSSAGVSTLSNQYTAQLGFTSYELDLWGRLRNLNEAALQQFLQSEDNQRNVRLGLVADVANAWLTLAADLARLDLARSTLEGRQKAFELTRRMYEIGSTSGLVLAQNQTTVDTARVDVAGFTAQVARDLNALQLLVGGTVPAQLWPTAQTLQQVQAPAALLPVPADLPSSVLLRRPDLQAAERNLRAMNANIGAARAALFPTISLTAAVGSGSRELGNLFEAGNGTWSLVPLVKLPIFDGGRNRANVQVAEANQQVALAQYEKAVQTAFRETADALADRAQWQERLDAQQSMVSSTRKAFQLSEARFQAGADNYLTVLDAQRSLYAAQQTLITLRLSEQLNRVTLFKVLGGEEGQAELAAPAVQAMPASSGAR